MELLLDFLNQIKKQQERRNPRLFPRNIWYCPRWEANHFTSWFCHCRRESMSFKIHKWQSLYDRFLWFFRSMWMPRSTISNLGISIASKKLLALAQNDPNNYYYRYEQPLEEVLSMAHQVWESINLVNLQHYIQPTRNRADLILHKATNHEIDEIYLKR